jgi:hypothetical protein
MDESAPHSRTGAVDVEAGPGVVASAVHRKRRMTTTLARPRAGGACRAAPVIQGIYFLLTGVWPLVSMRSFEAVTGPKVDRWLVRTVGVLVGVIGGSLLLDRRRPSAGTTALGVGSAAALGGIDVVYALEGRISRVYLLDAIAETVLVGLWLAGLPRPLRSR